MRQIKSLVESGRKRAVIVHTENARMFSKRLLYAKIIWLAQKFKDYATIYYPLQFDFRGRAYCVPAFLNYQSISGAKAMLLFSNGKEITKENKRRVLVGCAWV